MVDGGKWNMGDGIWKKGGWNMGSGKFLSECSID